MLLDSNGLRRKCANLDEAWHCIFIIYVYETTLTPGFVCFGRSSSGVDPVVSSHTRPSEHFTGWAKNNEITSNKRKVEGKNRQTQIQNYKTQEGEVRHIFAFCMYVWLWREVSGNPKQLPKTLTHLVIVFTARRPVYDFILPSDCSGLLP